MGASAGDGVRVEVISGVLETAPAALPKHAKIQRALSRFAGGTFDDDDGRGVPVPGGTSRGFRHGDRGPVTAEPRSRPHQGKQR